MSPGIELHELFHEGGFMTAVLKKTTDADKDSEMTLSSAVRDQAIAFGD